MRRYIPSYLSRKRKRIIQNQAVQVENIKRIYKDLGVGDNIKKQGWGAGEFFCGSGF